MSSFQKGPGEFFTDASHSPQITIVGLSTDTKPSPTTFAGYFFKETDTGRIFASYGGVWNLIAGPQNILPSVIVDLFNTSSITANTNFFTTALTPDITPFTVFDIYIVPVASGILSVMRTNGGVTVTEQLNSGAALTANSAYSFSVYVTTGDTVNLQYSTNSVISKLLIIETGS